MTIEWMKSGSLWVGFEKFGDSPSWNCIIWNKDDRPWNVTIKLSGSNIKFPLGQDIPKRAEAGKRLEMGVVMKVDDPKYGYKLSKGYSCETAIPTDPKDPRTDGKWIDTEFPPDANSLGNVDLAHTNIKWVRIPDVGVPGAHLFDNIEPNDIKQGELGDCWLLGAIASVAEFPQAIECLFQQKIVQDAGRYTVNLYSIKNKRWELVSIDDCIPCRSCVNGRFEPCFAQPNKSEMWVLLLEKAFAKFVGSYGNLISGDGAFAFQCMSGEANIFGFSKGKNGIWRKTVVDVEGQLKRGNTSPRGISSFLKENISKPELLKILSRSDKANQVMACSMHSSEQATLTCGLVSNHSYSLMKVVSVGDYDLVQCRNPWGNEKEWNGEWSDTSGIWKKFPDVATAVGFQEAPDGAFYMSFDDFTKWFDTIQVCPRAMSIDPCAEGPLAKKRRI